MHYLFHLCRPQLHCILHSNNARLNVEKVLDHEAFIYHMPKTAVMLLGLATLQSPLIIWLSEMLIILRKIHF